jgi:membrane-bound inhibitor of C-type lysozyme
MMILPRCALVLALGLVPTLAVADGVPVKSFEYQCEDGTRLSASFSPPEQAEGSASVTFADGKTAVLPQAISADGGRYVKDDIEFWIKGNGAMLTIAGKLTNCTTSD